MKKSRSQAYQDLFALEVCKNKTYIEIGAHYPDKLSNTLLLEQNNFTGFGIELDTKYQKRWNKCSRKNKVYWDNALTFNYSQAAQESNLTKNIGYLSCDIEPPSNTFAALQRIIEQGFEFECITFEHDEYQFPGTNYNTLAKDFLKKHNYKVAVVNVYESSPKRHFETWFVHNSIEFETVDFDKWKENFNV